MTETLTRAGLTARVYRELGLSQSECAEIVDDLIEELIFALEKGEQVKLSSFGTFEVRHKEPRIGRNPRTKEEVPISARNVVSFHASNVLTKLINTNLE